MNEQEKEPRPSHGERSFRRNLDRPAGKLAEALAKAQKDFKDIDKNCEVSFQSGGNRKIQYKYADLASVYKAVREALSKNNLALTHSVDGEDLVCRLVHSSGEQVVSVITIGKPGHDWKQYGAAITYATRYAISGLLGVASEEDIDAPPKKKEEKNASKGRSGPRKQQGKKDDEKPAKVGAEDEKKKKINLAWGAANQCSSPETLTMLAENYKRDGRSKEERSMVMQSAKARGWVWVWTDEEKKQGKFVAERQPGDEDDLFPKNERGEDAL